MKIIKRLGFLFIAMILLITLTGCSKTVNLKNLTPVVDTSAAYEILSEELSDFNPSFCESEEDEETNTAYLAYDTDSFMFSWFKFENSADALEYYEDFVDDMKPDCDKTYYSQINSRGYFSGSNENLYMMLYLADEKVIIGAGDPEDKEDVVRITNRLAGYSES